MHHVDEYFIRIHQEQLQQDAARQRALRAVAREGRRPHRRRRKG